MMYSVFDKIVSPKQYVIYIVLSFFSVGAFAQKTQKVDIRSGFLEKRPEFPEAVIYTKERNQQVYITHEGVEMWCDQELVYMQDNFVKALANVKIEQGDTPAEKWLTRLVCLQVKLGGIMSRIKCTVLLKTSWLHILNM